MAAENEISDLIIRFRIAMQQWQSDLNAADALFDQKKAKWQTPIQLGGAVGGGAGTGSGVPMIAPGVPAASGPSSSAATAAMHGAVATTQMQHAAVQAAPQAALFGLRGGMASIAGPGNISPGSGMGFVLSPGAVGLSGTPFGRSMVSPGMSPVRSSIDALYAQQAAQRDAIVAEATARQNNRVGVRPGIMPIQQAIEDQVQGAIATNIMPMGGAGGAGSGGGGMSQKGKMGLRNLIYGTVYGLIADVVAHGIGEASMYNQNMSLAGSNQGLQARALMGAFRNTMSAVPIIGGALSSIYGSMGANAIETQIQLGERQTDAQNSLYGVGRSTSQFGGQGSIYANRPGSQFSQLKAVKLERQRLQDTLALQGQDMINKIDQANPEMTAYRELSNGHFWTTNSTRAGIADRDNAQRSQLLINARARARVLMETGMAGNSEQQQEILRSGAYDLSTAEASVRRGDLGNRFTPMAALGRYQEDAFGASVSYAKRANMTRQDYGMLIAQGKMARNELYGAQRDITEQYVYGGTRQYNPYTESPLAWMERAKEGSQQGFDALQQSIDALTAAINGLISDSKKAPP